MITELASLDEHEILDCESIQSIIVYKWRDVFYFIFYIQLIPYITFLICYIVYSMYLDHEVAGHDKGRVVHNIIQGLLIVQCLYFLSLEVYQAYRNKLSEYVTEFWNYVDVIPPCLIIYMIFLESYGS